MPIVQVEAQISADKLLQIVQQMSLPELEQFVSQVIALQAQRKAPCLSSTESELLTKINQGLSADIRMRLDQLTAKRRAETLTDEERNELLLLTDQLETAETARLESLSQLAQVRGVSLTILMQELGIQAPDYA
jgi:excinuclease UvrABC ATPase subunit